MRAKVLRLEALAALDRQRRDRRPGQRDWRVLALALAVVGGWHGGVERGAALARPLRRFLRGVRALDGREQHGGPRCQGLLQQRELHAARGVVAVGGGSSNSRTAAARASPVFKSTTNRRGGCVVQEKRKLTRWTENLCYH